MTDSAWLETAKDDIAQWAMVMTKDADDNPIDWRWVRSLDLFGGLGHTAGDNPAPQAIQMHSKPTTPCAIAWSRSSRNAAPHS